MIFLHVLPKNVYLCTLKFKNKKTIPNRNGTVTTAEVYGG